MIILAIETSCDETAVAIVEAQRKKFQVFSHLIVSQIKIHRKYGGIVPEVAARRQLEVISPLLREGFKKAKKGFKEIDVIAVTQGPGLIISLVVGVETAKVLAYVLKKPLLAVNHLEGHIFASFAGEIQNSKFKIQKIQFPILALVVSGGHTQLVLMRDHLKYKVLGETRDDAAGEAFDKVAKLLNLGYPGGPIIEQLAAQFKSKIKKAPPGSRLRRQQKSKIILPRPMIRSKDYDFSFSGLKTAVLYDFQKHSKNTRKSKEYIQQICYSFQEAVIDVLIHKIARATREYKPKVIVLGGGVAANQELRKQLKGAIKKQFQNIKLYIPPSKLCTDNAVMVALAGYHQALKKEFIRPEKLEAEPNLRLG